MNTVEAMTRIKSIVEALTYTGGEKVLKGVHLASDKNAPSRREAAYPCAWLYFDGTEPFGHYGDTLNVANLSMEIRTEHHAKFGAGHVTDTNRASNAQQGASMTSILAKIIPATNFIDTDAASNHDTWIMFEPSSGVVSDSTVGEHTLRYRALVETT